MRFPGLPATKTLVGLRSMKQYRKASHCVYDLKYHIVWITKYRKRVLNREIGSRVETWCG